jgi:formylglycine-generating enzyme required for sulfatase activity
VFQNFNFTTAKASPDGNIEYLNRQGKCWNLKLDNNELLTLVSIDTGDNSCDSRRDNHDSKEEEEVNTNKEINEVKLTSPFLISRYTITQKQWYKVMRSFPQWGNLGLNKPVVGVSWVEALNFCHKLSEKENREFRLPYQSEWEFACCAGSSQLYGFGDLLTPDLANFDQSPSKTGSDKKNIPEPIVPVGTFPANSFGIHDMHGNVWEWCMDKYPDPNRGELRSVRGGAYYSKSESCACSSQGWLRYRHTDQVTGFRIVSLF